MALIFASRLPYFFLVRMVGVLVFLLRFAGVSSDLQRLSPVLLSYVEVSRSIYDFLTFAPLFYKY